MPPRALTLALLSLALAAAEPAAPSSPPGPAWVVRYRTPPLLGDRERLTALGGRILGFLPDRAWLARLPPGAREALGREARVVSILPLEPRAKLAPDLAAKPRSRLQLGLFPDADPGGLIPRLEAVAGGRIQVLSAGSGRAVLALETPDPVGPERLHELARLEGVEWIEPPFEPVPLNDDTIWVGQSWDTVNRRNYARSATIWNHGLTGTGQVVAVLDTGLDSDACYFKLDASSVTDAEPVTPPALGTLFDDRKVRAFFVLPGFDPYRGAGHGTLVAGVILGDDFRTLSTPSSGGHDPADGVAPMARLVMQVPLAYASDLAAALEQAHAAGARIHNNSWKGGGNAYSAQTREADEVVWRLEDLLVVFAAGNDGGGFNGARIASPGLGKNLLTAGSSTAGRIDNGDKLSSFSSRGPTFDGRIKPDVVLPGEGIVSSSSDGDHGSNNCLPSGPVNGTSLASPATAGFAALAREYYTDGFYPSGAAKPADAMLPSAALLKATLINSGRPLGNLDLGTGQPVDPVPSHNQGWGRVLLDDVLRFPGDLRALKVFDRPNQAGLETGARDVHRVRADPGTPLEVTLVWSDPPATQLAPATLVNDLDLTVRAPDGTLYLGNVFDRGVSIPGGGPDGLNNVEGVLIDRPQAGVWSIEVVARAVPGNEWPLSFRQGYALVTTHGSCAASGAATPGAPSLQDLGSGGVRVSFSPPAGSLETVVSRAAGGCTEPPEAFRPVGVTATGGIVDATVLPGVTYGYRLRASDGCEVSPAGPCAEIAPLGRCVLAPVFGGLRDASSDAVSCGIRLEWDPAVSNCPVYPGVRYNVYRSGQADFAPGTTSLLAAGLDATSFLDPGVAPGSTVYYVVRAEDRDVDGSGPGGGNEDANRRTVAATPRGLPLARAVLADDGGDARSELRGAFGDGEWSYSELENATPGGRLAYRSSRRDDWTYGAGACGALVSPPLALDPAGSPVLGYSARYNLEERWDGVVVEISQDGLTWVDLPPAGGYPSDFGRTGGVPINACRFPASRRAFSGPGGNGALSPWTRYTSDLGAWRGQTVWIRFLLSTDGGVEYEGFFLDDVSVTDVLLGGACDTCVVAPALGSTLLARKQGADVELGWTDVAGARSYAVEVGRDARFLGLERTLGAPSGSPGATDPGAVAPPPPLLHYRVRGVGNCGDLGP